MQIFMYKVITNRKRRVLDVDVDVVWYRIQVVKEKIHPVEKPNENPMNKALSVFLGNLGQVLIASSNTG